MKSGTWEEGPGDGGKRRMRQMRQMRQMRDRWRTKQRSAVGLLAACLFACTKRPDARQPTDSATVAASSKSNGPAASPVSRARATVRPTVLFVGTSLTAGLGLEPDSAFPMLIQRKIDSAGLAFDVVNAGVSGETSSGLLDRLDWLLRANFDVMVLETGANDGLRGIPVVALRSNLETALDRIKAKRPDARILLVQMEALPNLGPKYAADFHSAFTTVAKEKGVTLMPFLLTDVAGHRELNQADGVHPNNAGERIVAENLWRSLKPVLEDVARRPAAK
ncbi:MAG TPA: arylesterase [Gemmatimonadaceae bacterium]|nr:arylesterase [Gemmatimonadaceae bacterium]